MNSSKLYGEFRVFSNIFFIGRQGDEGDRAPGLRAARFGPPGPPGPLRQALPPPGEEQEVKEEDGGNFTHPYNCPFPIS